MLELMFIDIVVQELNSTERQVLENQEKIIEQLDEIKKQVKYLGAKLDEQVLVGARAGLRHLIDGINSETVAVRNDEYRLARAEFNKLISLNPDAKTKGTSGEVENTFLIGLGYWGNFHYFNLRKEKKNALIQVYELTHKYPRLGLNIFSDKFFSKDYENLIRSNERLLLAVHKKLEKTEGENLLKNLGFYGKQVLRGAAAGTVGAGGMALAGGTGGWLTRPVMLLTSNVYNQLRPDQPQLQDTLCYEDAITTLTQKVEELFQELESECKERLVILRKYNLVFGGILSKIFSNLKPPT